MTIDTLIAALLDAGVQLRLERGELRVKARQGQLAPDLLAQLRTHRADVVRHLQERQAQRERIAADAVPPSLDESEPVEATSQQKRMWFLEQMGSVRTYNIVRAFSLAGDVDTARLLAALCAVIDAHAALRTVFAERDGVILQQAGPRRPEAVENKVSTEPLTKLLEHYGQHAFDLGEGPLFRAIVLEVAGQQPVLVLAAHHIVVDGVSIGLLLEELAQRYREGIESVAPVAHSYLDYSAGRDIHYGAQRQIDEAFWTEYLRGVAPTTLTPASAVPATPAGADEAPASCTRVVRSLNPLRTQSLRKLLAAERASPYVAFLALLNIMLARYTDTQDICVGSVAANRPGAAWQNVVGYFANMLVLRSRIEPQRSFREVLTAARENMLKVLEHQQTPLEDVVRIARQVGTVEQSLPFQTVLTLEDHRLPLPAFGAAPLVDISPDPALAKFDLGLHVQDRSSEIVLIWEYRTDRFDAAFIERLAENFLVLTHAAMDAPDAQVATLDLLGPRERALLDESLRIPPLAYPREATLPALIEGVAQARPDAIALRWHERTLTYRRLDRCANALAHRLVAAGVRPGDFVGVDLPRSFDQIVGFLGILKAGAAYVPLDRALPTRRLRSMCADVAMSCCLVPADQPDSMAELGLQSVFWPRDEEAEAGPAVAVGAGDCCYVLFSSGSTGRPKGIACHHRGVIRLAHDEHYVRFDRNTVSLAAATMAFDAATYEIWPALLHGGQCVLYPDTVIDAGALRRIVHRDGVNSAFFTPALFAALVDVDPGCFDGIAQLVMGGDVLPPEPVQKVYDHNRAIVIINGYGPTENTVFTTFYRVPRLTGSARTQRLPIGRTLSHGAVVILDGNLQPLPRGMAGELCVFGDGVGLGYVGDPERTARCFVEHPLTGGRSRLYRTGDLAYVREDGQIDFMGRRDLQVKINGLRIELEEVTVALSSHPAVGQALTRTVPDALGEKRIVSYYVARTPTAAADLAAYLLERLPGYMVPRHFIALEELPLSINGKIDESRLPRPDSDVDAAVEAQGPSTPTERALADIWCAVLRVTRVDRNQHFYTLGGHSLLAVRVVGRINRQFDIALSVKDFLQAPTLRRLAERVDAATPGAGLPPIARVEELPEWVPVSHAQRSLWLLHAANPDSVAYNVPMAWRLRGPLNVQRLRAAVCAVVDRHEPLRSVFAHTDEAVLQRALPVCPPAVDVIDVAPQDLAAELQAHAAWRFDLGAGPAFKAHVLCLGPQEHVLLLNLHHILIDGWSMGLLVGEIARHYALAKDEPLPPLALRYRDYCLWQSGAPFQSVVEDGLRYWCEALRGAPPMLSLPGGVSRPAVANDACATVQARLSTALQGALQRLARNTGCSTFVVLLAAYHALLHRQTQSEDVVVGTPAANRIAPELEEMIGYFVNPLPLRTRAQLDLGFAALLAQVDARLRDALEHQFVPFEAIVAALQQARSSSYAPIFQTLFDYRRGDDVRLMLPGIECEALPMAAQGAKYDLMLSVVDHAEGLELALNYRTDLYSRAAATRLLDSYATLLEAALAQPERPLAQLPLLGAAECGLWAELTTGPVKTGAPASVLGAIEAAIVHHGERIAVSCGDRTWTYAQLGATVDAMAGRLVAAGVRPGEVVALLMERSPELVMSMLAVLKAGAAYAPLEPDYPSERLAYVFDDAAIVTAIADARGAGAIRELDLTVDVLRAEDLAASTAPGAEVPPTVAPDALAYLIYTSGSTGRPKGVMIEHAALANHMHWMLGEFEFEIGDRFLFKTPSGFDASVWEVYAPLMLGATMVIAPGDDHKDVFALGALIESAQVSVAQFVPSLLSAYLDSLDVQALPSSLRFVMCGGEALTAALCRRTLAAAPAATVVNLYGPTEATIDSTFWRSDRHALPADAIGVPIGRPVANVICAVLDSQLQPMPLGGVGELYIGGAGLARGYRHQPALTAERFLDIEIAGAPRRRYYRTGDLVRLLPNGELNFVGRGDAQVKMRGFRIELGEIEAQLARLEGIGEAAAIVVQPQTGGRIVAFVAPAAGWDEQQAQRQLRDALPDYMIPTRIVAMAKLPLTVNGKIDRAALLADWDAAAPAPAGRLPETPVEVDVGHIWQQVLATSHPLPAQSSFFALGGHSLSAVQAISRINRHFGIRVALREFLAEPTIEQLAILVEQQRWLAGLSHEPGPADSMSTAREEFTL